MTEHIRRDANYAAHSFVRAAIVDVIDKVRVEEISNCVYDIVCMEYYDLI
jgi:hypothetical protein